MSLLVGLLVVLGLITGGLAWGYGARFAPWWVTSRLGSSCKGVMASGLASSWADWPSSGVGLHGGVRHEWASSLLGAWG